MKDDIKIYRYERDYYDYIVLLQIPDFGDASIENEYLVIEEYNEHSDDDWLKVGSTGTFLVSELEVVEDYDITKLALYHSFLFQFYLQNRK